MNGFRLTISILAGILLGSLGALTLTGSQSDSDYDHGFIAYSRTAASDPVARLQQKIDSGEVTLPFDSHWGYLPAILDALKVPKSSQSLVFSKTSFQFTRIFPETPRALYFNDDVYVGFVQGSSLLEFAAVDPNLGGIFYTLEQDSTQRPHFQREVYACLLCHDSAAITGGVPGFMALSVFPDRTGNAFRSLETITMSDQTPYSERWGGWYVTGTHGDQLHRGNVVAPVDVDAIGNARSLLSRMDWSKGANLTDLKKRIDTAPYLTPESDIVALMTLTHQVRIHNLITRANYEVQKAVIDEEKAYKELAKPGSRYSAITTERIRGAVEPLVRGMFFVNEAGLTAPVHGESGFAEDFAKTGVRDSKNRSLKDLDLQKRFLRYPLSYLIYSESFDALPGAARDYFYDRAKSILMGEDESSAFDHLSKADRAAILEILQETKPEFASRLKDRAGN